MTLEIQFLAWQIEKCGGIKSVNGIPTLLFIYPTLQRQYTYKNTIQIIMSKFNVMNFHHLFYKTSYFPSYDSTSVLKLYPLPSF